MQDKEQLTLLIAEDDDGHAELIREGLCSSGVCNKQIRFSDGQEAWDFLNEQLKNKAEITKTTYLLLLDINMPRMDGLEVLRRMKENSILKKIPIIMLTTTDDPREVEQCYEFGCNVYITKPVDFNKFAEILKRLGLFLQIISVK